MTEKKLLKKSGICTCVTLLILSIFWFVFSIQTSFGYSGTGTTSDLKTGSRVNGDILAQPINGSVTIYFGTQSTQGTGSMGYIGTNTAGLPKFKYSYVGGSSAIDFIGFGAVYINGVAIPSSGSVSSKIDAVGGTGTNNLFTNLTVDGNSKIQSVGTENSFLIGGNLGLGTTTPDSKLHVEGNAIISGFSEYKGTGTPPIPTAGNSRLSAVTSQGITRIFHLNELGVSVNIGRDNVFIAKNTSGGTISKGQVVYVTGSVGAIPTIAKALANSKSTCSAIIGVIVDDILNNAFGLVMINGILESFDTSAFSTGDSTWVGTSTPGLLTNVRPVHPYYQKGVGVILNSGVGNGSMLVNVAPFLGNVESGTDVPAYTFAGDASVSGNLSVTGSVNFGTTTPSPSKIPISLGTGFLNDSWLSSVISKLGTDIQLGTETTGNTDNISEGSTNKYYTDGRVNAAVGSLSVNALSDVIISSPANGQFLKYTGSEWINGTSSASVAFSEVTGSATASQLPSDPTFPGTLTAAGYLGMPESGFRRVGTNIIMGTPTDTLSIGSTSVTIGTTTVRSYRFSVYNEQGSAMDDALIFGGLATADGENGGTASSAIDDNSGTYWQATTTLPHNWQYDFGTSNSRTVTQLTLDAYYSVNGRQDKDWSLQACNDAVSWGTITTGQDTNAAGVQRYNFANTSSYRYYRLVFTTTWHVSGANIALQEIQMFPGAGNSLAVTYGGNTLVGNRLLVGTDTALGTITANYVIQTGLNQRIVSGGNDVYCFGSIKSIIDSGESVTKKAADIAKKVKLFKYHPKKLDLPKEQIEKFAREKYRHSFAYQDFETFKVDNEKSYRMNKSGTHTINYKQMKDDFEELYGKLREDEFYLLANAEERILEMETMLESDMSIVNISAISTDPSTDDLIKGANPEYLSQTNMIGVLFGAYQDLEERISILENK